MSVIFLGSRDETGGIILFVLGSGCSHRLITAAGGEGVLVLGRRLGEYIVIDNRIMITVIKSEDGNLRLAIDAPPDVKIVRGEIKEKELKQKQIDVDINK